MSDTGQNKSEAPTERRREESRRKGQIAYSHELTGGLAFFLGIVLLWITAEDTWHAMAELMRRELLSTPFREWTPELTKLAAHGTAVTLNALAAPVVLTMWGLALVTGFVQTRGLVTLQPMAPDASRFSPIKGWQRIWSARALVKVVQVLFRTTVVLSVAIVASRQEVDHIRQSPYADLHEAVSRAGSLSLRVALVAAILLLATGLLDYLFEWWRHENELRMTLRELKDERKQEEGDPHLRARIRRVQRELAMNRMFRDAATADVVVRNPTHFAVALKYQRGQMAAPRVVAKGADFVAQRILEIAQENRIPVLERKSLARALFRHVKVGEEIPVAFYQVVAEVLIYVERLRRAA